MGAVAARRATAVTGKGAGGWKRWVRLTASLALGAGLLVLIFHDVELEVFWGAIQQTRKGWWVLCFVSFLVLHFARAWRWGRIVHQIEPVPYRDIVSINSVGFLAIQALPFRLGEFVRPYLLHERRDVPFGSAMYSVVVERTIDIICLAVMFTIVVLFADITWDSVTFFDLNFVEAGRKALVVAMVPFGGCLLAFLILQERAVRWTEAIVGRVHQGLATKAASMMQSFLEGVRTMKDIRFALSMIGNSVFIWALNVVCMWSLCVAFRFDDLGLMDGLVLLVVLVVGVLLPAPPLFAGIFEAFVIGGLALMGIAKDPAAAYAVVCHVTQTGIILAIGLLFLWIDRISLNKVIHFARTVSSGEQ